MSNRLALGVDVGGTKIAVALVDGKLGVTERIDVPSLATDGFELWGRIADATTEILSKADSEIVGIGIGSAGPIYPIPGTVSPVNIPAWRDFPLVKCFRDVFQIDRVARHNVRQIRHKQLHILRLTRPSPKGYGLKHSSAPAVGADAGTPILFLYFGFNIAGLCLLDGCSDLVPSFCAAARAPGAHRTHDLEGERSVTWEV